MADALEQVLSDIKAGKAKPFYLVHGEEFLARRAAEAICEALVPPKNRDLNFAQVDGGAGAREVAMQLDTVPMFRGTKVVFVEAADVLLAKRDVAKEFARAKELWIQSSRKKDAARRVLSIIAPAGWTYRDLDFDGPNAPTKARWKKEVGFEPEGDDRAFLSELGKWCAEMELKAPRDDAEALQKSVTQGPPKGNHLVLLCDEFDPKHPVARQVVERGVVIERKVESNAKGRGVDAFDIQALVAERLGPLGKKMSPGAIHLLKERIGPAMRQTASELDKLALYVGDRVSIEERDVELLVAPVREEEFFELSNALGDGDAAKALELVETELFHGKHPVLILAGMVSSIRRMTLDAARLAKVPGAISGRELAYRAFESDVFPRLLELGAGGKSAYPAYMNYKRIRKHGLRKLLEALVLCAESDSQMKTGRDGKLVLEKLILAFCGTGRHAA